MLVCVLEGMHICLYVCKCVVFACVTMRQISSASRDICEILFFLNSYVKIFSQKIYCISFHGHTPAVAGTFFMYFLERWCVYIYIILLTIWWVECLELWGGLRSVLKNYSLKKYFGFFTKGKCLEFSSTGFDYCKR